ncbi:putative minor fimbrial subunit StfG [Pragia fontium]|uniref:Pilin (Type 1 fimbria component protein) n=1 Tax=Pragia fontium DSM 5563 = ATCC 49100 TaxID=1122977 RepID=A0AAJ4W7W3_9GAMM|nr:fimbrial protein [Pragia fontium]SFC05217.1 Pilin (type 1 fimbria component protein) [Pragia fontium DSM 5563 = ATCC 49100]SUB81545.1 putative minor fimbrial subunit StfG [Pragia fontium]
MNRGWIGGSVCLLLALLSLESRAANHLDVTFNGTLLLESCELEQEGGHQEVILPTKTLHFFDRNKRTETAPFFFGLKGCTPTMLGKTVKLTFSSTQTQLVNGVAMLATSGNTGLVIGLEDGAGQAIVLGREMSAGTLTQIGTGGVNRYQFGAYALAPGAVKADRYSATVTVEVDYQ